MVKGSFLIVYNVVLFVEIAYSQATVTNETRKKFIPYGIEYGDLQLARGDDQISPPIYIPIRFPFFNNKYGEIKIEINGLILFGNRSYQGISYTPRPFPVDTLICIAPYWADIITSRDSLSNIFYREITDQTTLTELDTVVRNAFPGQTTHPFIWAFVVTWYEVPGYGLTLSLRNTLQAILATNGINSFAIYNYEKLQWTVGSASNNVHAQAGFNAGDLKNYFLIDKSFSPAIVNLVNDSNVGFPGRFVFSTEGAITEVSCNDSSGLQVAPFRGPPEGGYEIQLYGICLNETNYIIKIDQQTLTTCEIEGIYIACRIPMVYNGPTILIEVFTYRNELIGTTSFFIDMLEDNSELLIEDSIAHDSLTEMDGNDSVVFRFRKNSVTASYSFSIQVLYYEAVFSEDNELINVSSRKQILHAAVNLSSLEVLTVRYNDIFSISNSRIDIGDITITLLELTLKLSTQFVPPHIRFLYKLVKGTFKFVKKLQKYCAKWEAKLPELPAPSSYEARVPRCPCRVPATGQNRFPLTFNNFQTDSSCNAHKPNRCQDNNGASHCYRSSFEPHGPGIKCCYDNNGMIITNPKSGAGGLEVQANSGGSIIQKLKYALFDQLPSWACCKLPQLITQIKPESCDIYYQQRPSFQCENVPLPFPSGGNGDPHFSTLDGVEYTFNGFGEYVLIRTDSFSGLSSMEIQIRTKPVTTDSEENHATAIVAFVIKNGNYSKIQFELFSQLRVLEVRINDQLLDNDVFLNPSAVGSIDNETYQLLTNIHRTIQLDNNQMSITQAPEATYKISYSNRIQLMIMVREQFDFLSLVTIMPKSYERHCRGLLGNMDGDSTNDFSFQDGENILLPVEQDDEEKVFGFGESWRVKAENTLFKYTSGESYQTHQNLNYRPIFQKVLFKRYENTSRLTMANQSCQNIQNGKGRQQCIYDILITNDQTMSIVHEDFQTNIQEWQKYAETVNNDIIKSMGLSVVMHRSMMLLVIVTIIYQVTMS